MDSEHRTVSPAGIELIKSFEGCRLTAYRDAVGVWTIGYGHTDGVRRGHTMTQEQAEACLRADLRIFERTVEALVAVPLTQGQFDALVSFAFNVGGHALRKSTLLRLLNDGDYAGAQAQFARWKHAGGRVLNGLVRRRAAEAERFAAAEDELPSGTVVAAQSAPPTKKKARTTA